MANPAYTCSAIAVAHGTLPRAVLAPLGIAQAPVIRCRSFKRAQLTVMRLKSERNPDGRRVNLECDSAWVVHMQLRTVSSRTIWLDGCPGMAAPSDAGSTNFYDARRNMAVGLGEPIDILRFHLPLAALDELADELGVPRAAQLSVPCGQAVEDPVIRSLAQSVLFAIERPGEADPLFLDHIALAFRIHLATTYAGVEIAPNALRGRLTSWQERRAREMLESSLATHVSLEDVAQACGLSLSYFARAFRQCMGEPPHRWLMKRRIAHAKDLLTAASLPLAEVALACGFADQSHFGRAFTQIVGRSPGAWRRGRTAPAPAPQHFASETM